MKKINLRKIKKLILCIGVEAWRKPLRYGVAAAVEHDLFFKHQAFNTVVDIGANTGQFSLVMRKNYPEASIFAFEPLRVPFLKFRKIFEGDTKVRIFNSAIAPTEGVGQIYVSESIDSSSLLPISDLQNNLYPGTSAVGTENIAMGPLRSHLSADDINGPSLLKIDVQGYELEVLRGCDGLLDLFDMVYCECSFYELYSGQALAPEVIKSLAERNFSLQGFNNVSYDEFGNAVQADFIFRKVEQ